MLDLDPVYLKHYCDDPEFFDIDVLFCSSYYPALGEKTIYLEGRNTDWNLLHEPVKAKLKVLPSTGIKVRPEGQSGYCSSPDNCKATFKNGYAKFYIKAEIVSAGTITYFDVDFEIDPTTLPGAAQLTYNALDNSQKVRLWVRDNSNITVGEVLNGSAVLVYDNGKSNGPADALVLNVPDRQTKLHFVQELLNQVVTRKRMGYEHIDATQKIPNEYTMLGQQGYYKQNTYNAVNDFKNYFKFKVNTKISYTMASVGANPSFGADDSTSKIFRKLMRDYNKWIVTGATGTIRTNHSVAAAPDVNSMTAPDWLNGIIDRETLIGKEPRVHDIAIAGMFGWYASADDASDHKPGDNGGSDSGLYEMYVNVVKPFVNTMITTAEGYENNPKEWYDRDATTTTATKQKGVSYSFGGKQSLKNYNDTVATVCTTPTTTIGNIVLYSHLTTTLTTSQYRLVSLTSVSTGYKGNVDETNSACPSNITSAGTMKYPGLKQDEQNSFNKGLENKYYRTKNAQNQLSDPWPAYDQFKPSYWAGIDCSGLAQRAVQGAKDRWDGTFDLRVTIPSFKEAQTAAGIDAKAIKSDDFDCDGTVTSGRCVESWTNATPTTPATPVYVTKQKARAYVIDKVNADLILKGDVVRYSDHVALVYSDKPTSCTTSSGVTGCTYEIIHAYGTPEYFDKSVGKKVFSRKVVKTRNDLPSPSNSILQPTGLGRIKLWD